MGQLLQLVPDTVWAALIAAALALSGVALSNRHSRRLLETTIENDALQRDRDRQMALRREVFIPAADAVVGLLEMLVQSADPDADDAGISTRISGLTAAVARIQVVGKNQSVKAAAEFLDACCDAYADIRLRRLPIKSLKNRNAQFVRKLLAETKSWPEQDKDRPVPVERWDKLHAIIAKEGAELRKDIEGGQELVQFCMSRSAQVGKLVPPLLLAIREELGLSINEAEFLKLWAESHARSEVIFKRVGEDGQKVLDGLNFGEPAAKPRPATEAD